MLDSILPMSACSMLSSTKDSPLQSVGNRDEKRDGKRDVTFELFAVAGRPQVEFGLGSQYTHGHLRRDLGHGRPSFQRQNPHSSDHSGLL